MDKKFLQFVNENFFTENLFDDADKIFVLEETDAGGESVLHITCDHEAVCIRNCDKKNTDVLFFRSGSTCGLTKRVDHIVFENFQDNDWYVHLIEMKSSVTNEAKWYEIKAKFRASYLLAKMMASVMEIHISACFMYTTYNRVKLEKNRADTVTRKAKLGFAAASPQEEWSGEKFALNINGARAFRHTPVWMEKNEAGILEGKLHLSA